MNQTKSSVKLLLGAFLLSAAAGSLAVSFGSMRGAAIVGSPLDVTLTTQVDPSAGLSALCIVADVFFGDNQIPSSRVNISVERGVTASQALVRIRTNSVVDEPVVTVVAQGGCAQKNTRKYVLLAELLADRVIQTPVVVGEVVAPTRGNTRAPAVGSPTGNNSAPWSPATASQGTRTPVLRPGPAVPQVFQPSARVATKAAPATPQNSSRPRLKLEPIDLSAERDPVLRASLEMLTKPSSDVQQREAAAALWRAINAQPEDILRDNQRLKVLETEAALMRSRNRKNDEATLALRAQLEEERDARYNNPLVYALGGLLAALLIAAVFFGVRGRRESRNLSDGPWWSRETDTDTDDKLDRQVVASLNQKTAMGNRLPATADSAPSELTKSAVNSYLGATAVKEPITRKTNTASTQFDGLDASSRPGFLASMVGMPRIVNAEELFDVQQHADFFVSLGDFDKAIEVLRSHITDNVETSALAYLDLFDLYHSLGRKEDYVLLRKDFNLTFNAQVPAFDDYKADTHGLEFYSAALSRIELLWPTPKVLDVIEESIFRKPDSSSDAFSLAAYRELLLLHAIAKKIIERPTDVENVADTETFKLPASKDGPEISSGTAGFSATKMHPLPTESGHAAARTFFPEENFDLTRPHRSPRLGLDIDLSMGFDTVQELEKAEKISGTDASGKLSVEPDKNLLEFHLDSLVMPVQKNTRSS
jgi:hypothetical protein